jgi:hypothetical protein
MKRMSDLELRKPSYLANLNPLDTECPVQQEDIKVPSIIISQPASVVLKEEDPAYIDGLKAGQFYNKESQKIYGKSMRLQFIHYFKVFNVYKGTPQSPEWVEALPESEFIKLPNMEFRDFGVMTPAKPDMFIKKNWRFVVANPDEPETDFMFFNVKPGGISDAKMWVNTMYKMFKQGVDVLSIVWEMNTYSKASKTSNASSYQIEGSKIKQVGFATDEAYHKAVRIRDEIKKSQNNLIHPSGDEI